MKLLRFEQSDDLLDILFFMLALLDELAYLAIARLIGLVAANWHVQFSDWCLLHC